MLLKSGEWQLDYKTRMPSTNNATPSKGSGMERKVPH